MKISNGSRCRRSKEEGEEGERRSNSGGAMEASIQRISRCDKPRRFVIQLFVIFSTRMIVPTIPLSSQYACKLLLLRITKIHTPVVVGFSSRFFACTRLGSVLLRSSFVLLTSKFFWENSGIFLDAQESRNWWSVLTADCRLWNGISRVYTILTTDLLRHSISWC